MHKLTLEYQYNKLYMYVVHNEWNKALYSKEEKMTPLAQNRPKLYRNDLHL